MAVLKDSGARRNFGTGAVRDAAEGKGRCDLLPLGVIAKELQSQTLDCVERYIRTGETKELWLAIKWAKVFDENIYTELLEVSKQYEDGCLKYGDRNWENGIPLHCYIDSGVRHYLKFLRGDTDEPHDRAFIWNMLGAIWTHENKPELIDLPFANKDKPDMGNPITETAEKTEPSKWEGLSDKDLAKVFCRAISDDCDFCPISIENNGKHLPCCNFRESYPNESRTIMTNHLEGRTADLEDMGDAE